jgi:O-antigen/teichoic acid export membrane protein
MERATLYAMANRLWASASGLLTAAFVAWLFTPELQGYYFTFLSLLTFQTFLELGFGELLQQFVSHEWERKSSIRALGAHRGSRLASLFRFSVLWYGGMALLLFFGLGLGGSIYFRKLAAEGAPSWELAWWLAVAGTALAVLLTPVLALLEGGNQVRRVYGLRLAQGITTRVAGILAMVSGFGLFTIAVMKVASFVVGIAGIGRESWELVHRLWRAPADASAFSYRREILPLQWKFALSWLSGYLLYSLFTPVLFAFYGAELAGRMGMTVAAGTAISSAAFAVIATKVPTLAMLAARGAYDEMDALFRRATLSSVLISLLGGGVFLSSLAIAAELQLPVAQRFLPALETSIFLAALVVQQVRMAMGSYLRAHKQEPLAALSVVEALLAVPLLTVLARELGALGMILGFTGLTLATLVPAVHIFRACRARWHVPSLAGASA